MPEDLHRAIQAEIDEPGHVTKDELRAVLEAHPLPTDDGGDFADDDFDTADFG